MVERGRILYRNVKKIKAGQVERFEIDYAPESHIDNGISPPPNLWVKVKNKESMAMRAAYLAGPYVLYVDCRTGDYDINKNCFITADQPVFEPQLLPGQSFYAELSCHHIKEKYCWTVDVVSQILFNSTIAVDFEIMIGTSKKVLHESTFPEKPSLNSDKVGLFTSQTILNITNHDIFDLWNLPLPDLRPIHLVILTHGLHSNVGADMFYLKERIDKLSKENVVVKGYFGNICKTERGIKYLGSRTAEFIVSLVTNNELLNKNRVKKISFIGHSLGGLTQTFAIAYLQNNYPWFFQSIEPCNFITLASPFLGVMYENPAYVKIALLAGMVGKSGQDLSLKCDGEDKPLLELLPTGPTHQILKRFKRRTVYANVANDAIVPLRTSALLFLDNDVLLKFSGTDRLKGQEQNGDVQPSNKMAHLESESTLNKEKNSMLALSLQALVSYFTPQKQRQQAGDQMDEDTGIDPGNGSTSNTDLLRKTYKKFPKTSILEIAASLILPPLPTLKYITDPNARDNVIVHDKVYTEKDIETNNENTSISYDKKVKEDLNKSMDDANEVTNKSIKSSFKKKLFDSIDNGSRISKLEEEIARAYHKNMSWRKVLVHLKPDAHNNIIARRRFANAYGWPVIEHLVQNHFLEEEFSDTKNSGVNSRTKTKDELDAEVDLSSMLSRELIEEQNKCIDKENENYRNEDHSWINTNNNAESLFATGPTGLLSDMVESLYKQWYNYGDYENPEKLQEQKNEDEDTSWSSEGLYPKSNDLGEGSINGGFF